MAQGIILAGGESSRANTIKTLLSVNGKPLISHTIESLKPFVNPIVVVTGKYHDELLPYLNDVEVIRNNDYQKGMFSSVLTGVKKMNDDFFVIPADCPFVKKEVFEALLNGSFSLRVPTYNGHRGHPLFISKLLIDDLLKEDVSSNLRNFMNRYDVEEINVSDPNVLNDIDTIADYHELIANIERN